MPRVAYLVDGFNLYPSLKESARALKAGTRWLDLRGLCESYLHLFGSHAQLKGVYYFSALAKHLEAEKPDVTQRHERFIRCLTATGVEVVLGRFKKRNARCKSCEKPIKLYEEKETDVAIAVKLLELLMNDKCDIAVIMSGDTDLAPALRTAHELFPHKEILFAFPYARTNKELKKLAPGSYTIKSSQYINHQFSSPFSLPNGRQMVKPQRW